MPYKSGTWGAEAKLRSRRRHKYFAQRRAEMPAYKKMAQAQLYYALKTGKVSRALNCQECLAPKRLQAHHPDYDKPLEVLWLCGSCHRILHPGK